MCGFRLGHDGKPKWKRKIDLTVYGNCQSAKQQTGGEIALRSGEVIEFEVGQRHKKRSIRKKKEGGKEGDSWKLKVKLKNNNSKKCRIRKVLYKESSKRDHTHKIKIDGLVKTFLKI